MKKYSVDLKAFRTVEVEAETALEAVKIAKEQNPEFAAEGISSEDGQHDIEICDGCGEDMLDTEVAGSSEDGDDYCKGCWEAIQSEYLAWAHQLTTMGYEKGVMIPTESKEDVDELYSEGKEPEEALAELIKNKKVSKL